MKKGLLFVGCAFLLVLQGCKSPKAWIPKRTKKDEKKVNMPLSGDKDKSTKVSFFDSTVEAFEDMESFVLEQEAADARSHVMVAQNNTASDADFTLEEHTPTVDKETQVVYFDYDSSAVRKDQKGHVKAVQDKIAEWAKKGYKVVFKGHSCLYHGTPIYNAALSNDRAFAVAKMFDLKEDVVKVFGVGNEEPVVFENTIEKQAPNRRVEIYPIAA